MAIGDKNWLVTKPAGGDPISSIDGYQADNNYALETILSKYRHVTTVYNSSTTEITIGPSEVTCTNGTLYRFRATTGNITCTASLGASKWYKVYAVADATATTFTGEIVEDGSTPAGTYTRLISMFRTTSGSVIVDFVQVGDTYTYTAAVRILTDSDSPSSWTALDMSTTVPASLSTLPFGIASGLNSYGHGNKLSNINTQSTTMYDIAGNAIGSAWQADSGGFAGRYVNQFWRLQIFTANTLYYLGYFKYAHVQGFEINKL